MIPPPVLINEKQRIKALQGYAVLDTLPERALDDLTKLAAAICEVPTSMISFVDEQRQWFKSRIGFPLSETPRDISFCGHALGQEEVFMVPDALEDERFADNPMVTGDPHIRFYAGAPLITADGEALGTLCVNDRVPRVLSTIQVQTLQVLASQVMTHLELSRQTQELIQSEQRLQTVAENARVGLVMVNKDRRYGYANETYSEILGLATADIVGLRLEDVLGDIYREKVAPKLDRAFAGEIVAYDLKIPASGSDSYFSVRYNPTIQDNEVIFVVAVITEITDRKLAEMALRESVRFAQATIDALSAQLCVLDNTGTILATNEAWRRFAEANPPPAQRANTGDNYLQICDEAQGAEKADAIASAAGIRSVLSGKSLEFNMEYPCHSPTEQRWFVVKVTRFSGEGPVRAVVAHEDVTERKQAEIVALRLAAIVACSDDAIIGKDLDGIITSWNRGAEKIFGYTAEEMVGTSILRLIPLDQQDEEDHILGKIRKGESVEHFETLRLTKNGRLIDVSVTASPIRNAQDEIFGVSKVTRDISERKRAEAALREGEQRLRFTLESCNIGAWDMDLVDHTAYRSVEHALIFGYKEILPEWTLENFLYHVLPEYRSEVEAIVREATAAQRGWTYECPIRRVDGEIRWIWFSGNFRVDTSGHSRVGGVIMDITERKQAEEARRESDARYRSLFEHAPDGIVIVDSKGYYLDVNVAACRMFGYSRDEFIGLNSTDVVALQEIPNIGEALDVIENKSDYHREWQLRRKDGTLFPADTMATAMPDGNLLATIRDITERKRSEHRFRRLVDSNAQGVMFWNKKGEITDANNAFLEITGYSREDLEAGLIDWKQITPAEYIDLDQHSLEEIAATGISRLVEKEYFRKNGTRVPVLIGAASFEDNSEEGICFVIDLSERKNLEQQFLRSQRMESIGTLAGGIAHDLNNVLGPIIMSLEIMKMKFPDKSSQELLSIVSTSAQRGADMVRQVLSFARGVEGRKMEVQLKHLITDIEKIVNDTFLKNIHTRTIIPNDLWTVMGDPTQLHQVLLNLCVNARDAMPDGGSLSISAENLMLDAHYAGMNLDATPGPYVVLQVEDSGTGMPQSVIEKIFDPFFTTKEIGKGTGLGLSTSMAIVKSHGGFLRVYSEPKKGTKFKVYFPAQTEISSEAAAEAAAEMPRGNGELILVVDDESAVRQITQQTLQAFGYRVVLAADGAEALATFARQGTEISAVITDMMMPVMDGPATIRVLRKLDPKIRIIAASGLSANGGTSQAMDLGVKHFLTKPYTAETLLMVLRQVLTAPAV